VPVCDFCIITIVIYFVPLRLTSFLVVSNAILWFNIVFLFKNTRLDACLFMKGKRKEGNCILNDLLTELFIIIISVFFVNI